MILPMPIENLLAGVFYEVFNAHYRVGLKHVAH